MPESTVRALRGGRRHPARRLRAAAGPLSRQHRDHAAGGAALHLRPLCRRAAVPAHSRRALPDRRRRRARHRPRGDPRIDRRLVRLHGQGRGHRRRGARDAGDHAQDLRAAVRLLVPLCRSGARRAARPGKLACVDKANAFKAYAFFRKTVRRMRRAPSRRRDRPALCRCLLRHAGAPAVGLRRAW